MASPSYVPVTTFFASTANSKANERSGVLATLANRTVHFPLGVAGVVGVCAESAGTVRSITAARTSLFLTAPSMSRILPCTLGFAVLLREDQQEVARSLQKAQRRARSSLYSCPCHPTTTTSRPCSRAGA